MNAGASRMVGVRARGRTLLRRLFTPRVARSRRQRLPDRRFSETRKLTWRERTIYVNVGYDPDGLEPREVFYADGYRSGADMEALVSDLCIALSVMLQQEGVTAASLSKSMGETFDVRTGNPMPASILGLLLEELSRPPVWADALAQAEATEVAATGGNENSVVGALDRPGSGEAGRPGTPGSAKAARRHPEEHGPDEPATKEKSG